MLPWIRLYKRNHKKVTTMIASLFLVTFFIFCFVTLAHAQGDTFGVQKVGSLLPLGGEDIRLIIAKIIRIGLGLLGIIAVGLIMYAGFTWMTSGGNEEKIGTAKKTMINATIGLAIIMSAFAITQFILNALANATGSGGDNSGGRGALNFDSYLASGSLGRAIKDHYPLRDQHNVHRNTRLAVTFFEAVDPASIIRNTNGTAAIGDCIRTDDPGFNWGPAFCDQLNTSTVKINIAGSTSTPAVEAAALVTLEGANNEAHTFLFRPLSLLGSEEVNTDYSVDLTSSTLKKDGITSVFAADAHHHYTWRFQTDTSIDTDPPYVVSVYPSATSTEARNSLVQINFNEAMDPIVAQGMSGPNSAFSHIIFNDPNITGQWRISNGYSTLEFTSDIPCGQNSCGETMYCLPVDCQGNAACPANPYGVLIRTAITLSANSFESVALSGIMDMSGNALDNGPLNESDGILANPHRAGFVQGEEKTLHNGEKAPDNYYWGFNISNSIDRSSPVIEKVTPNLDQESVAQAAVINLNFSKRLSSFSLFDISLEEHPLPATLVVQNPAFANLGNIWFRPSSVIDPVTLTTIVTLDHRVFGPQGTNFYYFPLIPSSIKSVTQNCLYPGRGPFEDNRPAGNISAACDYSEDEDGNVLTNSGCVGFPRNFTADQDTGCVQYTNTNLGQIFSSTSTCMTMLKSAQISPLQPIVPAQGGG